MHKTLITFWNTLGNAFRELSFAAGSLNLNYHLGLFGKFANGVLKAFRKLGDSVIVLRKSFHLRKSFSVSVI